MLPYWLLFVMWMMAALAYNRSTSTVDGTIRMQPRASAGTYLLVVATALLVGLRYEVGADWETYLDNYNQVQFLSFSQSLGRLEIGYATLVYIASRVGAGIWVSNLCCALIMTLGIMRFCIKQPNPGLTFLVAIPYLVIVIGMGYTRQGVAIGLILAGLAGVDEGKPWKLVLYVVLATLFHRTALLALPLVLSPILRRNLIYAFIGLLVFCILFYFILSKSTDQLITNYSNGGYESSGATVRVAMNVVPAVIALLYRRKLGFNSYQTDMWTVFAVASICAFALVVSTSFSTAIDRLALFLIPLQLSILPRLPYMFGGSKKTNAQLFIAVCGYSSAVQLIWLVFASHAFAWVPYQAYFIAS